jgi:hypothetical protein
VRQAWRDAAWLTSRSLTLTNQPTAVDAHADEAEKASDATVRRCLGGKVDASFGGCTGAEMTMGDVS